MPYPTEYATASADFDHFLDGVKTNAMLQTRHQAWQVARAVLLVFRNHLTTAQALRFADALPPLIRAMFVEGLDAAREPASFPGRAALDSEVASVRRDHNFVTETSIDEVAAAFWQAVDPFRVQAVLAEIGTDALAFWAAGRRQTL